MDGLDQGRFSLADFYARRIRRIFPALVLAAVLLYGAVVLLPGERALLGRDAAGGAGFVANLAFWTGVGYFDRDAASLAGIALIALALVVVQSGPGFPGWWALLPTLGAGLLIAAGPQAVANRRLLALPPMVSIRSSAIRFTSGIGPCCRTPTSSISAGRRSRCSLPCWWAQASPSPG